MNGPWSDRPFLCFIHIEKCAGITLHHLLQYNYVHYAQLRSRKLWSNSPSNYFRKGDLRRLKRVMPWLRGIGGHTTRSFIDYSDVVGPSVFKLAFFREPRERYLSHLNYQRQIMEIDWKVDDFLGEKRFDNYQTVRLAGEGDLRKALEEVDSTLDFVGLTEKFDKSLLLLQHRLRPWLRSIRYERRNVTPIEPDLVRWDDLSREQQERVDANNRLDHRLYDEIRNNIFPKQVRQYGSDLEDDLVAFRASLQGYRYPAARRILLKLYRNVIRYVLQPLARIRGRKAAADP